MSDATKMKISLAKALKSEGKTDWQRLQREDAAGVEPEGDDFGWLNSEIIRRPGKQPLTIRVDEDVLEFFRATGKGYQTRINAVLRAYVEAQGRRKGSASSAALARKP